MTKHKYTITVRIGANGVPSATVNSACYHSWCCQKCGEHIGWLGRFFSMFNLFHKCKGNL